MARPYSNSVLVKAPLMDLQQGLFTDVHPMNIPLGGASYVRNLVYVDGYVRPRAGVGQLYSSPDAYRVVHINRYVPLSGDVELIRISKDNSSKMHIFSYKSGSWVRLTPLAGIAGVLSSTYQPHSANFAGKLYITPGDGDIYVYDGTTLAALDTLISNPLRRPFANPRYIAASESRLFIADFIDNEDASAIGAVRYPYGVAWCDSSNPELWSTGSTVGSGTATFQYIPTGSEPITALYAAPNSTLMVFKAREIYLGTFVGSPKVYKIELQVRGPGCVSQATIREWRNNSILWLGDDNVYLGVPGETPQPVGDKIRPSLYSIGASFPLSKARAVIDRTNDLYHLIIPDSSSVSGTVAHKFTLNLRNNSWWEGQYNLGDGVSIEDALDYRTGDWQSRQLLATSDGRILEQALSYTSDDGNAFATRWESGVVAYRSLSSNKSEQGQAELIRAIARSGSVNFELIWGDGMDRFTTTAFGSQNCDGTSSVYTSGRQVSEHFKVAFYHSDVAAAAQIMGIIFGYIPHGDTR